MFGRIIVSQAITFLLWWSVKGGSDSLEATVVVCTVMLLGMIGLSSNDIVKALRIERQ